MDFEVVGPLAEHPNYCHWAGDQGAEATTLTVRQGTLAQAEGHRDGPSPRRDGSQGCGALVRSSRHRAAGDEDQVPATGLRNEETEETGNPFRRVHQE